MFDSPKMGNLLSFTPGIWEDSGKKNQSLKKKNMLDHITLQGTNTYPTLGSSENHLPAGRGYDGYVIS